MTNRYEKTIIDAKCPRCLQWNLYREGDKLQYIGFETIKGDKNTTKHYYKCPIGHRIELWEIVGIEQIIKKSEELKQRMKKDE